MKGIVFDLFMENETKLRVELRRQIHNTDSADQGKARGAPHM